MSDATARQEEDYALQHSEAESGQRRTTLLALGVMLVISFFLPIYRDCPGEYVEFVNFTLLRGGLLDWSGKFMLLYPLLSGMAVIVLALTISNRLRGVLLLLLFALPILQWWADSDTIKLPLMIVGWLLPEGMKGIGGFLALMLLGSAGLLVALRTRSYRPGWNGLYWLGLAGAILFGASQAIRWPFFNRSFAVGDLIHKLIEPTVAAGVKILGGFWLFVLFLLAIGAAIAVFSFPRFSRRGVAGATAAGYSTVKSALVLLVVLLPIHALYLLNKELGAGQQGKELTLMAFNAPKLLLWLSATAALLPTGLIELILGSPATVDSLGPRQ